MRSVAARKRGCRWWLDAFGFAPVALMGVMWITMQALGLMGGGEDAKLNRFAWLMDHLWLWVCLSAVLAVPLAYALGLLSDRIVGGIVSAYRQWRS